MGNSMKKNYVIDDADRQSVKNQNNAWNKARSDINSILAKDYEVTYFICGKSKIGKLLHYFQLIFEICFKSDRVVLQYPFYNTRFLNFLSKHWLPKKCIVVIHDLDSLRQEKEESEVQKEIRFLNKFQSIISHNERMTAWLKEKGCHSKIVNLELFDYLTENKVQIKNKRDEAIAFAGNLSPNKSEFLYKFPDMPLKMHAYGNGYDSARSNNIEYMGSFPAERLPVVLNEKFGLIWDGTSTDKCEGSNGRYLRYNNPHKTSLYLVSGLPVIVWKEAAIALFVERNQVGITVDSLEDLKDKLDKLSDVKYSEMLEHTREISARLQEGYYLKHAIAQCLED